MDHTYYLDFQRHTFRPDELAIRPFTPSNAAADHPPQSAPVLFANVRAGRLGLRRQPATTGDQIATAKYPASSAVMEIRNANHRTELTHSYVQVDAYGRSRQNASPERSFWRRRIKDGSRGCYVCTMPDGTSLRWEPAAGPNQGPDAAKKTLPKLRCVLVDGQGASAEVLGEMMASNDVVKLMRGGELVGERGILGIYVLLGFISLYERARARNKRKAELEFEVDFTFDGDGGGGGGDGGGGDGGGGD
ncbi:hypothetical protein AAE478_006489 [Parahypoxylon ruwenzoriense]